MLDPGLVFPVQKLDFIVSQRLAPRGKLRHARFVLDHYLLYRINSAGRLFSGRRLVVRERLGEPAFEPGVGQIGHDRSVFDHAALALEIGIEPLAKAGFGLVDAHVIDLHSVRQPLVAGRIDENRDLAALIGRVFQLLQ